MSRIVLQATRRFSTFTHVDTKGQINMVNVSHKTPNIRTASASAKVLVGEQIFKAIVANECKKGDVICVSKIAGIQAAKSTHSLIPLCHSIALDSVQIDVKMNEAESSVEFVSSVVVTDKTGCEMEALTAVGVASLTLYDMCKAMSKNMVITNIQLQSKTGGKSGDFIKTSL